MRQLEAIARAPTSARIYTTSMYHYTARKSVRTVFAVIALALMQACASPPSRPDDICSIFAEKRGWHKAAVSAQKKWGTSMHIPMAFMYQESTFRAKVKPARRKLLWVIPWRRPSSAYGYAQAIDGTWRQYQRATGQYWRVRHDFSDATDFIHWYIRQAMEVNDIAANDAYNLYLNYHEGIAGYARRTYQEKPWLIRAAENVQLRSQRYREQYRRCQKSLRPGIFGRLMGW